jgi:natural product precursor
MEKINLKNIENKLSRNEMRKIQGGYSWLYCYSRTIDIPGIVDATITNAKEWDACRAAKDPD